MPYVRNAWYVASWEQDIEVNKPFGIKIIDEPIVIYRCDDGRFVALADRCVHRMAPLSLGRCEGDNLRCMYHGMLFSPEGRAIEIPGQEVIPPQAQVRAYPVIVRHSWVWIWMGHPDAADATLIPPAIGFDNSDWILGHGFLDYASEARLINDNLTDFSHLSYVHEKSFQPGDTFAYSTPKITPLERGVRVERWTTMPENSPRNPKGSDNETFMRYDYLIPGVLLMWTAQYPQGTGKNLNFEAPEMEDAVASLNFTSQAVTPTGEQTARYFFSWGPHCRHGDEAMRDGMMQLALMAFGEDKVMIEAQQSIINSTPYPTVMPTAHDKGVTLFNRLVERMCRQEDEMVAQAAE